MRIAIKSGIIFLFLLQGLYSCQQTDIPLVYEISLFPEPYVFPFEESETQLTLKSNYKWSIHTDREWLTISPATGDSGHTLLNLHCSANPVETEREAKLEISSGSTSKVYTIYQTAKGVLQFNERDTLVFEKETTLSLTIQATLPYEFTVPVACNWISWDKIKENQFSLHILPLEEDLSRTVPVMIQATSASLSDTIYISQSTRQIYTRQILEKFYHSLNGDQWYDHTHWLSDKPLSQWEGITIIDGELQDIVLYNNNLSGNIPEELYNLNSLRSIKLAGNHIRGSLSPRIRNLKNLHTFVVEDNLLTGEIPAELWALPNLEVLNMSANSFQPITIDYAKINKNIRSIRLRKLNVSNALSPGIGALTQLRELEMSGSHINGKLPKELFQLKKLYFLHLGYNNIKGELPPEIGYLTELEHLYLCSNYMTGTIPEELGKLTKLEVLYIEGNYFTGKIPPSVLLLPHWPDFNLEAILPQRNGCLEIEN